MGIRREIFRGALHWCEKWWDRVRGHCWCLPVFKMNKTLKRWFHLLTRFTGKSIIFVVRRNEITAGNIYHCPQCISFSMYPASYFSLSMHTNIFGKLHQTMMSRVILVRTDTKLKVIARHWEDVSDLENVLHNIIIWSYSFPAPNASLLTQFCALSLYPPQCQKQKQTKNETPNKNI